MCILADRLYHMQHSHNTHSNHVNVIHVWKSPLKTLKQHQGLCPVNPVKPGFYRLLWQIQLHCVLMGAKGHLLDNGLLIIHVLDIQLLCMITGRALKGAEPRKQLPITEMAMNKTDISNLNTSPPIRLTVLSVRNLIHNSFIQPCYFINVIAK